MNVLPVRYLSRQAVRVFREEGACALARKGFRKTRRGAIDRIWSLPFVWKRALRTSRDRLSHREESHSQLDDILDTAFEFEGVGLYRTMEPYQRPDWLRDLCRSIPRNEVETVVEIGTARGGTLYVWSRYFRPERIVSIDVNHSRKQTAFFDAFTPPETTYITASSYDPETVERVREALGGETIDFLFIDGDHRYSAVKRDFESYSPLVRTGGWICLDDIQETDRPGVEVHLLWEELVETYETYEIRGGIGIVRP